MPSRSSKKSRGTARTRPATRPAPPARHQRQTATANRPRPASLDDVRSARRPVPAAVEALEEAQRRYTGEDRDWGEWDEDGPVNTPADEYDAEHYDAEQDESDEDDEDDGYDSEDEDAEQDESDEDESSEYDEDEPPAPRTRRARGPAPREVDDDSLHTAQSYKAGNILPLPTGGTIIVRPMSLTSMVERTERANREGRSIRGGVPNALLPAAKRMLGWGGTRSPTNRQERRKGVQGGASSDEHAGRDSVQMINWLAMQLVASFRVVNKPPHLCEPDEVSVHAMHDSDKIAISEFSLQGQTALTKFRRES